MLKIAKVKWSLLVIACVSVFGATGINLLTPWLSGSLVEVLTGEEFLANYQASMDSIYRIAALLLGSFIIRIAFRFGANYYSHVAAWHTVADLRIKMYGHLQKLSLRFYHTQQTGQLMSRTINDTGVLEQMVAHVIPDLITNILILSGVSGILLYLNPRLTLLTLIPIPFIAVGSWFFAKHVRPRFRKVMENTAVLNAVVHDNLQGIREIQVFNKQETEQGRVASIAHKFTHDMLKVLRFSGVFHPTMEMITSLGTVIIVLFGGIMALHHQLSVADIVRFMLFIGMFYAPVAALARMSEELSNSSVALERVLETLDTEPDIFDNEGAKPIENPTGRITFEDVEFSYLEDQPVLQGIRIDIEPGKMVALVGPTGVGKTTLVSLIARFYDPTGGKVLIDGQDARGLTLESLRSQISVVLQDVYLFNGTIGENIAYGVKSASPEEIEEAAKAAHIHDFIASLPDRYDTVVGERGIRLSGGQKQRLSIARAVLRRTPILILDEATSSVDMETEKEIQAAIAELSGKRTVVVIAHRLSTVRSADCIYVLEEGRVTQSGKHAELMADANSTYARLCATQMI
jgi:ATP-binding cassette subfamily B protein/subfamily B ATP-binding cassette protein MsbA